MMFNKGLKKQVFTGLAAVALLAPLALGGGQAHASLQDAFNQQSSQQANDAAKQQENELDKQQSEYGEAHKDEIDKSMNAGQDNGTPEAKANTARIKASQNQAHSNASSNHNSKQTTADPDTGADTSSKTNYDYSGIATDNNHNSNSTSSKSYKDYKNDKSQDVKYPNAPKDQKSYKKSSSNKELASQLNDYGKKIRKKAVRNDLKKATRDTDQLHSRKSQKNLKKVAKYIHGTKNRRAFKKLTQQL